MITRSSATPPETKVDSAPQVAAVQPLKIAVLGMGSIGTRHARILSRMPNIELTCVPSRPERVGEISIAGARVSPSIDVALQDRQDGVVVATDSGRHVSDSIAILASGASVLIEKPMATNGADASRILDASISTGQRVHVACCLRFDPGLRWVRERLSEIGPIILADAECLSWLPGWRPDRDYHNSYSSRIGEGGVLLDLIHEVDYCAWLLGPLRVVGAVRRNSGLLKLPPEIEETVVVVAVAGETTPVTIRLSYIVRESRRSLRIIGENGELHWDPIAHAAVQRRSDGTVQDQISWKDADEMYEAQMLAWTASLRGAADPALADVNEGIAAVRFCDAVRVLADSPTSEASL